MYNAVIQRPLLKVPGMKAPAREVQMDIHSEDDWLTVSLDLSGLAVTGATLSKTMSAGFCVNSQTMVSALTNVLHLVMA